MTLKNRYKESIRPKLLKDLGLKNIHQVPKVINGKDKGKTGEVLKTIPLENRVVVKGINLRTKHVKPTQEGETGRILTEEASLHASNVMFFSKEKNLTSKIEYFIDKEGVKKRRLKKTGEVID